MFTCPNCQQALARQKTDLGVLWICEYCHGRAIGFDLLRNTVARKFMNSLWRMAIDSTEISGKTCPGCDRAMAQVSPEGITGAVTLDLCTRCHFLWFDARETEALPFLPPKPEETPLSPEAREILALHRVEMMERESRGSDMNAEAPDEWWQTFATLAGFPVEENASPLQRWPLVTWLIAAMILAVDFWCWQKLPDAVATYGLIPAEAGRWHGLTFVTSFFLHANLLHLVGNLYFLVVFGDDVEDYLGKFRFALLVFLATLAGGFSHVLLAPHSPLPSIGASGGISGILAFYALRFPHVKLTFCFRAIWFQWIRLPTWGVLILWFLLQGFGVWKQAAGLSNISSAAHLGGAIAGIVAWILDRQWNRATGLAAR